MATITPVFVQKVQDVDNGENTIQDLLMYQSFFDTFKTCQENLKFTPDPNLVSSFEAQIRNALLAETSDEASSGLNGLTSDSLSPPSDVGYGADDNSLFGSSEVMLGLSDDQMDEKPSQSVLADINLSKSPSSDISSKKIMTSFQEGKRSLESPQESSKRIKISSNSSNPSRSPNISQTPTVTPSTALGSQISQDSTQRQPSIIIPNPQSLWPAGFIPALNIIDKDNTPKLPITRLKTNNALLPLNTTIQPSKQQKKVAHNAIERRYRNNINDRIADLKNSVPALCQVRTKNGSKGPADKVDGIPAATKLNKATILRKATEYIQYLRNTNENLKEENTMLRALLENIEGGSTMLATIQEALAAKQAAAEQVQERIMRNDQDDSDESNDEGEQPVSPQISDSSNGPPTPPTLHKSGPAQRTVMAMFMGITFFGSPSGTFKSAATLAARAWSAPVDNSVAHFNSESSFWSFFQMIAFIVCLLYVIRPDGFVGAKPNKVLRITQAISLIDTCKVDLVFDSLSRIVRPTQHRLTLMLGIIAQSLIYLIRRLFGLNFAKFHDRTEDDEQVRLLHAAIWARLSEVEIMGGNAKISRMSVLHSLLKTLNHLEMSNGVGGNNLDAVRIYATAALQSLIVFGQHGGRSLADRFWEKARLAESKRSNLSTDSWLQILFMASNDSSILSSEASRDLVLAALSGDPVLHSVEAEGTIPLAVLADAQMLLVLNVWYESFQELIASPKRRRNAGLEANLNATLSTFLTISVAGTRSQVHLLITATIWARYRGSKKIEEWLIARLLALSDHIRKCWWLTRMEADLLNSIGIDVMSEILQGFEDPVVDDLVQAAKLSLDWLNLIAAITSRPIGEVEEKLWDMRKKKGVSESMHERLASLARVCTGLLPEDDGHDSGFEDSEESIRAGLKASIL